MLNASVLNQQLLFQKKDMDNVIERMDAALEDTKKEFNI